MHVSRKLADGKHFVRPPTTENIVIKSMPSGTVVYTGPGPGLAGVTLTTEPPADDTELTADVAS